MKNKLSIVIGAIIGIIVILVVFFIIPIIYENRCKTRVFEDMQSKADIVEKSVIGIIPENKKDGLVSHNGIGSGVIFDKKDNTYYAVTAAHVIEDRECLYKVFTKNTEFSGQSISANESGSVIFEIPPLSLYQLLFKM